MMSLTTVKILFAMALGGAVLPGSAPPKNYHLTAVETGRQAGESAAQHYFTDTVLVNQNGEDVRFYTDLLKDRVVIIDVFFTECQDSCPRLNRNMQAIQDWLGDRLGTQARLISISVDPVNDTPPRLRAYADRFHAKQGWVFLTGKKENVDFVLYKLGQKVEARQDHSAIILIGNERTGLWKKASGIAPAEDLVRIVESVLNDKR